MWTPFCGNLASGDPKYRWTWRAARATQSAVRQSIPKLRRKGSAGRGDSMSKWLVSPMSRGDMFC
jgi:hypothetical protein